MATSGEDGLGGGGGGGASGTWAGKWPTDGTTENKSILQNSGDGGDGIVIIRYAVAAEPPAPEWDIPGVEGGINGFEGEGGVKTVSFEAIELTAEGLKVNLSAAKIDADGATFGLICKTDLTSDQTIVINATLAAEKDATEGVLTVKTDLSDYPSLFVVGIGPKVE